jgi:prolyl oligopeptidase
MSTNYISINWEQLKKDKGNFGADQKRRYIGGYVTEDNRYLVISAANSTYGNELHKDLTKQDSPISTIVDNFNSDNSVIDSEGTKLYIETDLNAPNKRIVTVDVNNPSASNWLDFIPETERFVSVHRWRVYFANYMKDAVSVVKQYDYSGKMLREIVQDLQVGLVVRKRELYYSFTNYTTPGTTYSFKAKEGNQQYIKTKVDFKVKTSNQTSFYTSKDGTKIPMMITYKS